MFAVYLPLENARVQYFSGRIQFSKGAHTARYVRLADLAELLVLAEGPEGRRARALREVADSRGRGGLAEGHFTARLLLHFIFYIRFTRRGPQIG